VTISIVIFVAVTGIILAGGIFLGSATGILIGLVAFQAGYLAQAAYLWWVCRPILRKHREGHAHPAVISFQ